MARPTKSSLLYIQQAGRLLRPYPAPEEVEALNAAGKQPEWIKQYAILLDFTDNSGRHTLNCVPTLFGLRPDFDAKGKKIAETVRAMESAIEQKRLPINLSELRSAEDLKAIAERIDLFAAPVVPDVVRQHSKLAWISNGAAAYHLSLPDYVMLRVQENTLGKWEVYRSVKGVRTLQGVHNSLGGAFHAADDLVPWDQQRALNANAQWRVQPATDKQIDLLWKIADRSMRNGFPDKESFAQAIRIKMSKGDASVYISQQLARR